jgi:hypothetical protein
MGKEDGAGGRFPESAKVKLIGWASQLWKKAIFGVCGELWCFVVDFRFCCDYFPFVLAFTRSCGADFCAQNVDRLW